MDVMQILVSIIGAIAAWNLKTTIEYGNRIAVLENASKSDRAEANRRFDELSKRLDEIKIMLLQVLKHRRSGDGTQG